MDFEKIYAKLPEFIKYNNFILDFFLKIPKKIDKLNKRSNVAESQKKLFELILLNSDFKVTGISRNVQLLYLELLRFIEKKKKKLLEQLGMEDLYLGMMILIYQL